MVDLIKFKELRKVWSGNMYLIVRDGTETVKVFPSIKPFDASQEIPWIDDCGVWAIKPDTFNQNNDGVATCMVEVVTMN